MSGDISHLQPQITDAEDLSSQSIESLVDMLQRGLPYSRSLGVDEGKYYNEFEERRKLYHVQTIAKEMIQNAKRFLAFQNKL
jgi:hypothetical protein